MVYVYTEEPTAYAYTMGIKALGEGFWGGNREDGQIQLQYGFAVEEGIDWDNWPDDIQEVEPSDWSTEHLFNSQAEVCDMIFNAVCERLGQYDVDTYRTEYVLAITTVTVDTAGNVSVDLEDGLMIAQNPFQ